MKKVHGIVSCKSKADCRVLWALFALEEILLPILPLVRRIFSSSILACSSFSKEIINWTQIEPVNFLFNWESLNCPYILKKVVATLSRDSPMKFKFGASRSIEMIRFCFSFFSARWQPLSIFNVRWAIVSWMRIDDWLMFIFLVLSWYCRTRRGRGNRVHVIRE